MKELILVRHAKSSWKDSSLDDFDRPLNKRGKKDAPLMGKRLAAKQFMPEQMISSPAKRAWSTARVIAKALDYPLERIARDDHIYEASLPALIDLVRSLDTALSRVLVVGHNPGITELANWLTGGTIPNLPTCAVCCVEWKMDSWDKLEPESGTLVFFDYPKKV